VDVGVDAEGTKMSALRFEKRLVDHRKALLDVQAATCDEHPIQGESGFPESLPLIRGSACPLVDALQKTARSVKLGFVCGFHNG
jgi:hypothetical protein